MNSYPIEKVNIYACFLNKMRWRVGMLWRHRPSTLSDKLDLAAILSSNSLWIHYSSKFTKRKLPFKRLQFHRNGSVMKINWSREIMLYACLWIKDSQSTAISILSLNFDSQSALLTVNPSSIYRIRLKDILNCHMSSFFPKIGLQLPDEYWTATCKPFST